MAQENLEPRVRDSALIVLRRYSIPEDEIELEKPKTGGLLIKGHRVRIHVDSRRADFQVRGGRWGAAREDYPSLGSFLADFEGQLDKALSGRWR